MPGRSRRRWAGRSPTPSRRARPSAPCCRTGSPRPPARSCTSTGGSMPLASDVDIYAGQRPDEDPSLAVRNNGGVAPSAVPAPAGRREALLLLSFGGPEGHDDVMPFLENVTRGRGVPRERLEAVAEHYHHFGGVSPINDQNKALIAALEKELAAAGIDLPIYWGN